MKHRRGYTVIEVMLAMAIFTIAAAGLISLQRVSTVGNMQAKEMATASRVARTWIDRLHVDSSRWNYPSPAFPNDASDIGDTIWLRNVTTTPNVWFRPADSPEGTAAFDVLGNNLPVNGTDPAAYCANLRLAWMNPPNANRRGDPESIRVEVRVHWRRTRTFNVTGGIAAAPLCNVSPLELDTPAKFPLAQFHLLYEMTSVAKQVMQ